MATGVLRWPTKLFFMVDDAPDPKTEARKLRAKGRLNESVAKVTGNDDRAAEGRTQKTLAGVREYAAELTDREQARIKENKD